MTTTVEPESEPRPPSTEHEGVLRYYELAKKAEWEVRDLSWGDIPPVPETTKGSPDRKARRLDLWRSVITQQYQADVFAVEMASQLLVGARHFEAKLYYTTMVRTSPPRRCSFKLIAATGGATERDPYLDQLAHMFLELDSLEEKVFLMQVFFERLIIPRFRLISRSAPGTVLAELVATSSARTVPGARARDQPGA